MKERIAQQGTKERHEQIVGAIARGWCHPKNESKTMDSDLAMAIAEEVETLLKTDDYPKLGCATTRQLIDEICARLNLSLEYRTIDS